MENSLPPDPRIARLERAIISGHVDAAYDLIMSLPSDGANALTLVEQAGQCMTRLYGAFHGQVIESLWTRMASVQSGAPARLRMILQPDVEITMAWRRRLSFLTNERFTNQLIDAMKSTNMPLVNSTVQQLLTMAHSEEDRKQRLRQIGSVLGGLLAERERALAFVRSIATAPERWNLTPDDTMILLDTYKASASSAYARSNTMNAASSKVELTQAIVELSRALPGRMSLGEPTEKQIADFDRQMRALLRCVICTPTHECLPEVVMILSDFAPHTLSTTGAMAGVEQRLYSTLGRTARFVSARVFGALGDMPVVSKLFLDFAIEHAADGTRLSKYSVEALGVLHVKEATPFLIRSMQARRSKTRMESAYALGAISGKESINALLKFLGELLREKVLDVEKKHLAFTIIESIGRALRPLQKDERNALVKRIIKIVPLTETDFKIAVLMSFFNAKVTDINHQLCEWAARNATELLWLPEHAQLAMRGAQSPLGWRQPLVDLLIRLITVVPNTFVDTALGNLGRYCGAYLAVAEICARAPMAEQLPLLRQMVLQLALQTDDHHGAKDIYKKESIYDPATETFSPLTRDAVLASIIYAVSCQKSEEGEELLSDIFKMGQSKRLPMPGRESTALLMEAHMKVLRRKGESVSSIPVALQQQAGKPVGADKNEDEILAMLNDLSTRTFFKKTRRQKCVAALAGLAAAGELRGLPQMIELLADKDMIIAGAAQSALLDLIKIILTKQTENENLQDLLLRALLLVTAPAARERIAFLLTRMRPEQEPLKGKIVELMGDIKTSQSVKLSLAKSVLPIIQEAEEAEEARENSARQERQLSRADEQKIEDEETDEERMYRKYLPNRGIQGMKTKLTDLDKKRAYMMARREWINGGKRGPEPQPPK